MSKAVRRIMMMILLFPMVLLSMVVGGMVAMLWKGEDRKVSHKKCASKRGG